MKPYFVYILRCDRGVLYTGVTPNLGERIRRHLGGRGAKAMFAARPLDLVFLEKRPDRSQAQIREAEIKKLSKAQKERLVLQHRPGTARGVFNICKTLLGRSFHSMMSPSVLYEHLKSQDQVGSGIYSRIDASLFDAESPALATEPLLALRTLCPQSRR